MSYRVFKVTALAEIEVMASSEVEANKLAAQKLSDDFYRTKDATKDIFSFAASAAQEEDVIPV